MAIEQLGGRFLTTEYKGVDPRAVNIPLILDDNWKGKREDLVHFARVLGLRRLYIVGTKLDPSDFNELAQMPTLEELHVYGTQLEPADLEPLKAQLPQATLDYRRGGLLGVSTQNRFDETAVARADTVQPGSAAAKAGLQQGDVIRRFNGEDVENFQDLTKKIGACRPGDEVSIEVLRNGETKKFTATLGQWTADHVINQLNPP